MTVFARTDEPENNTRTGKREMQISVNILNMQDYLRLIGAIESYNCIWESYIFQCNVLIIRCAIKGVSYTGRNRLTNSDFAIDSDIIIDKRK